MKNFIFLLSVLCISSVYAQDFNQTIQSYFDQNRNQHQLTVQDVADVRISAQAYSKSTKVYHVYAHQQYQGIDVFNAITNFAISPNQEIKSAKVGFISNIAQKINTTTAALTATDGIVQAASRLGLESPSGLELIEDKGNNQYVYNTGNISHENIHVKLVFQPNEELTALRLAWDISILTLDGHHWYSVRIDAQNGDLLSTHDWMTQCDFGDVHVAEEYLNKSVFEQNTSTFFTPNDGSTYRVYAMPIESPSHGDDTLESEPGDANASPFGWHDTNGIVGAEYTSSRGNNVRSRADLNGNNTGNEAQGGPDLEFDFPYNFNNPPIGHVDASITNLFYWNNIVHDVMHYYGFDEESWNFQQTNYSGQGLGNDYVNADAQDGSGTNNANFGTPPEGQNPRMQMFLWDNNGINDLLTINNGPLAGEYGGVEAGFGEPVPTSPITANLVLALDGGTDPYDACQTITNGAAINNRIAVIRRGDCEFGFKVLAAEEEGALAVIIVNNVAGAPIVMGPGEVGDQVNIPSIMISQEDGESIIDALADGDTISGTLVNNGPFAFCSSLDSGIIAHEYGHGISNRLTGGGFNVGCLQNDEQMGEGWSDYFGLILTMKPGDTAEQSRGIGTYVIGQPNDGVGIRPAPYSTSFSLNDYTYGDTNNAGLSQPHGIGFVWASMLWDLTWDLIDEYGFDPDIYNGTGGNNIALQLVMDGLKLQVCSPGFVDGRDAIIEADLLANDSENYCIIWRAFAKRGLGLSASQGSSNNRFDQVESFNVPVECQLSTPDESLNQFMIFPNPTEGVVNIVPRYDMGASTISIFDINGRKVFSQDEHLNSVTTIHFGELNSGIYILQITGENYSYNTKLIIK